MHYYSFHIKDYHLATAHLSLEEDACYRRILDMYYDTEGDLPDIQRLAKRIRATETMVLDILNEFFTEIEGRYFNQRADNEIASYQKMSDGGKKGAANRWAKGKLQGSDSPPITTPSIPQSPPQATPNSNHKPLPINQEPNIEGNIPYWIPIEAWNAWVSMRVSIKKPLTARATKRAINKLSGFKDKGYDIEQILDQAENGKWTDLYEPKEKPSVSKTPQDAFMRKMMGLAA